MTPPTNPTVGQQIHSLDIRVSVLEVRGQAWHDAQMAAIASLKEDLSDQGRTPPTPPAPVEQKSSAQAPSPRPFLFGLVPGTGKEIAVVLGSIVALVTAIGGASFVGAKAGGNSGATTAVEEAVEMGEAVPVAAPVVRVVPVPVPVVPAPAQQGSVPPEAPAPVAPVIPNDLMDLPR